MKRRLAHIALTLTFSAAASACGGSTPPDTTAAAAKPPVEAKPTVPAKTTAVTETTAATPENDGAITEKEREAMLTSVKSGGAPDDVANCVVDSLAKGLTRNEFIAVTKAQSESDVPVAVAEKANTLAIECALSASGGTPGASTDAPAVPETTAPDTAVTKATQTVGTKNSPIKLGSSATLETGYGITINTYTSDANSAIAAANEYNDKPTAGMKYVMVNLTILNDGGDADKRVPGYDLPMKAVSASGKAYENSDCSAVTPEPIDRFVDVFKGTSITGNVCFLVANEDAEGLTLYIDVFTADYSTITYYFGLQS